jgi:hypothetical protein
MNKTEIITRATDPQHQKVHIKLAKVEIMDGLVNFNDAILNMVAKNDNFRWTEQEIREHKEFLARAKRKIEGLYSYFNLPE